MGLTVSNVTTATSTTSNTTLEITGVSADVGDMLVVMIASDNSETSGTSPISSISDDAGNTWTQRVNRSRTSGNTVDDGVAIRSYTSAITSALSSGTITVTFSTSTRSKVALVKKVVAGAGEIVGYDTNGGANGNSSTPSTTSSSVPNGYTIMGFVGAETAASVTGDLDTTNGSWSTQQTNAASTGTNSTSIRMSSQQKTVTATGDQTYNPLLGSSTDWSCGWMRFYAAAAPGFGALLNGLRNRLVIS